MDTINTITTEVVEKDINKSEKPEIHRDKKLRNNKSSRSRRRGWLFRRFAALAGGITGLIRTRKCNAPDKDQSKSEHQIELTLSKIEQPGVEANERNSDERCHGSKPYYQPSEEPTGTR